MKTLTARDLAVADDGSYYTILGCGEPLEEWVKGYEKILETEEIGKPTEWFQTTGASVNLYATTKFGVLPAARDLFKDDLTLLMFPLIGLHVGRLAMTKLFMSDRWFDDIVENMRPGHD